MTTTSAAQVRAEVRAAVTSADAAGRVRPQRATDQRRHHRPHGYLGEHDRPWRRRRTTTTEARWTSHSAPAESRVKALIPNSSPAPAAMSPGTRISDCHDMPASAATARRDQHEDEHPAPQRYGTPHAGVVDGEQREQGMGVVSDGVGWRESWSGPRGRPGVEAPRRWPARPAAAPRRQGPPSQVSTVEPGQVLAVVPVVDTDQDALRAASGRAPRARGRPRRW